MCLDPDSYGSDTPALHGVRTRTAHSFCYVSSTRLLTLYSSIPRQQHILLPCIQHKPATTVCEYVSGTMASLHFDGDSSVTLHMPLYMYVVAHIRKPRSKPSQALDSRPRRAGIHPRPSLHPKDWRPKSRHQHSPPAFAPLPSRVKGCRSLSNRRAETQRNVLKKQQASNANLSPAVSRV